MGFSFNPFTGNLDLKGAAGAQGPAGNFTGPGASTDNAAVRFDGAGGNLGQDSKFIISDTGSTTAGSISGDYISLKASATRELRLSSDAFTLGTTAWLLGMYDSAILQAAANVSLYLEADLHVRNNLFVTEDAVIGSGLGDFIGVGSSATRQARIQSDFLTLGNAAFVLGIFDSGVLQAASVGSFYIEGFLAARGDFLVYGNTETRGAQKHDIVIKTTDFVVAAGEYYIVGNHATIPFTGDLPDAATNEGRVLKFKNKGAAAMTLDATGLGQIFTTSANNTLILNTGDMYSLTSDGTTWLAGD